LGCDVPDFIFTINDQKAFETLIIPANTRDLQCCRSQPSVKGVWAAASSFPHAPRLKPAEASFSGNPAQAKQLHLPDSEF